MIVANPSSPLHPLHSIECHPERSEGSAFRFSPLCALRVSAFSSPSLSPFSFKPSTLNLFSSLDALDAASSVSPLPATLTKNTRGGGTSHASAKNSNRNPSVLDFQLSTVCPVYAEPRREIRRRVDCFLPISFIIRTYAKRARNPFRIRTSKTQHLKPFRIRTYRKKGRGVARTSLSASSALHSLRVSGYSAPLCYLFPSLRLFNLRLSTALLTAPYSTTHCPRPFDKASSLV
jgi:hypothetical protein